MCGCLSRAPYWGPGLQPSHVLLLGIKPATDLLVCRLVVNALNYTSQSYFPLLCNIIMTGRQLFKQSEKSFQRFKKEYRNYSWIAQHYSLYLFLNCKRERCDYHTDTKSLNVTLMNFQKDFTVKYTYIQKRYLIYMSNWKNDL